MPGCILVGDKVYYLGTPCNIIGSNPSLSLCSTLGVVLVCLEVIAIVVRINLMSFEYEPDLVVDFASSQKKEV